MPFGEGPDYWGFVVFFCFDNGMVFRRKDGTFPDVKELVARC